MSVKSQQADVVTQFHHAIGASLPPRSPVVLSVSGGGDSVAMMHLAAAALPADYLHVITVDHGLRPGAADEIAVVAAQAKQLKLPHHVLKWSWDGTGNLQAAARDGRWRAISDWAERTCVNTVLLGHTEDDQVETLLLRLARGSGVDGLTAMARIDLRDGVRVVRPLLDISRDALRDWLRAQRIAWCDDPSNDDPRFDRVRARQMFAQLSDLGLTRKRLLQTVDHMQAAHQSLQIAALAFARAHVRQDTGDLIFAPAALDLDSQDAPRRVMAAAFGWVSSRQYRPRFDRLRDIVAQAAGGRTATLGGCILLPERGGGVRMVRESSATVEYLRPDHGYVDATGVIWDRRWFIEGPMQTGLVFRALGEGIRACPDWRSTGLPATSLRATPSVWSGDCLLSAPVAGFSGGWTTQIVADFHSSAFAH